MDIQNVGIIGTGAMGLGIAQVCAHNGFPVTAVKATPGSWERAKTTVEKSFGRIVERGKMTADERDAAMSRITFSTDEHAAASCDLIIESVIEDIDTKKDLFRRLESICRPDALLTTNTSTLSVTAMMAVCKHRGRVAGLHFFNPAPVMKLVEIIHGFETSDETLSDLDAFCNRYDTHGGCDVRDEEALDALAQTARALTESGLLQRAVVTTVALSPGFFPAALWPQGLRWAEELRVQCLGATAVARGTTAHGERPSKETCTPLASD